MLDPGAKVLFRDGQPVTLTRKAAETLEALAERAGEVVTKEALMAAIWPDRVVDEANLTQQIAVLRKAMQAAAGEPGFIETFPARGYRMVGPVDGTPMRTEPGGRASGAQEEALGGAKQGTLAGWLLAVGLVALLTAAAFYWGGARSEPAAVWTTSTLTRLPGKETQPALSPDAQRIAFLNVGAESALYLASMGNAEPKRISAPGVYASSPAWSADGRSLAYLELEKDTTRLARYDLGAGATRTLCSLGPALFGEESRLLAWAPDGNRFALVDSTLGLSIVELPHCRLRSLTKPGESARLDADPRFSRDGKTVSFLRHFHRLKSEVFTVPAEGGTARALTNLGRPITSHDWDARGEAILFAVNLLGEFRVHSQRLDEPKARSLELSSLSPLQISTARQDGVLVYAPLTLDRNIWRLELARLAWQRVVASTAQDSSPRLSPDGRRLLFRSDRQGSEHLYVSEADGSGVVALTKEGTRASVGHWSEDGARIVFNDPLTLEVSVLKLGTGQIEKLPMQGLHPVFAPGGEAVLTGGRGKILRWPLGGGEAELLLATRALSLAVDPRGEYLYFAKELNDGQLYRLQLATKRAEPVLSGLVPGCTSCWAVGRNGVYYLANASASLERQELRYRNFKSGASTLVLPYPEPLWPEGSGPFSLSADERFLYTVRLDPDTNADLVLARRGVR